MARREMVATDAPSGGGSLEALDVTFVAAAIQERMIGQDPMLERYGRVARAVLLGGELLEPASAHDFSGRLTDRSEEIGVTASFDGIRSLTDISYTRARGTTLRIAEVMVLPLTSEDPIRSATFVSGFVEANKLKSGRISDVIRNMGVVTAKPAEIRHFIGELEDQIDVSGLL